LQELDRSLLNFQFMEGHMSYFFELLTVYAAIVLAEMTLRAMKRVLKDRIPPPSPRDDDRTEDAD
jgi:hypothetical protein